MRLRKTYPGFTLMEIVIVLAFMVILFGMTSIFGLSAIRVQELDRATETARSELSLVRDRAMSGNSGEAWGVAFATSSLVEFRGSSYATRNPGLDLEVPFSGKIRFSGLSEVVFLPPYGRPKATGTLMIFDGSQTNSISVNAHGMIETQ